MRANEPAIEIDERFSSPEATARTWADARTQLAGAEIYWLSTIRPEGRPHVTPLIAVWVDDALYFCTGPDERKAKNLAGNPSCVVTTGCNTIGEGLDVVVEGAAERVRDDGLLQRVADAYVAKYGPDWTFSVEDGAFHHGPEDATAALVFEVAPSTAFGFAKGEPFSQTRYRF